MTCLAWYEPGDPHTWEDNFLCWRHTPPPAALDAGAPPPDASPRRDVSAPRDASMAPDVPAPDPDSPPVAPPRDAAPADLAEPWPDTAVVEPAGCGCRAPRGRADAPLALLGLSVIALRRKRLRRTAGRA
jgi:MYXO-CTERM domain-containing protein